MRSLSTGLVILAAAALLPTFSIAADTFTLQIPETTESVSANNPCFGPITGTLTYTGVLQVTQNRDIFHVHIQIHGTGTVIPASPNIEPLEGHFSEIQVENLSNNNSVDTFVVTQLGNPGLGFHITFHVVADSFGVKVQVFNTSCG